MDRDLALDPEQLRPHAARLAAALGGLSPPPAPGTDAVALLEATPAGRALAAELDRLTEATARAGRELAELAAVLAATATAASRADSDAALALRRLADGLS